jgi:DNA polymerase elongation subunit (family B)
MDTFNRKQSTIEKKNLSYQILSWEACDEEIENFDSENEGVADNRYHIYSFGVDENGESVCVRFDGYKPYFFACIPDKLQGSFDNFKKNEVERFIRNKLFRNRDDLESVSVVVRKKYKGFTNEKQ